MGGNAPLRILAAHLTSEAGGNPDLPLLYGAIRRAGDVEVRPYSADALLRERWDIVHFYWPEWCISRDRGAALTALDAIRLIGQLQLARARGARVVWSANNIRPHESDRLGVTDRFLKAFSMLVDQVICSSQTLLDQLQAEYPAIRLVDHRVIPLGHYRGVYPDDGLSTEEARAHLGLPLDRTILLCLGIVRPYKNLVPLVRCYRTVAATRDDTYLLVAGKPLRPGFADQLRRESAGHATVRLDLRYITDDQIQFYLKACDRLIVPTSLSVNSGSAMLALSFDRPVVLPDRATFTEMRETLGAQWVHTYQGGLREQVVRQVFDLEPASGRPPLDPHHNWDVLGRQTLTAYQELVGANR